MKIEAILNAFEPFIVTIKPPVDPGKTFFNRRRANFQIMQVTGNHIQFLPHFPKVLKNDVAVCCHSRIIAPFLTVCYSQTLLKLDSHLRFHAVAERVFDLRHFGDEIGDLNQLVFGVAAGDDHMGHFRLGL